MVQIIRKISLPNPSDLPERLHRAASEALKISLREPRPVGFPLLFSSEMRLIEPALQYLHEHGVQRAHSSETVRTYAEILYDWFETLEQNSIDWSDADAVNLVAYRNRMIQTISGHTKRPYHVSTINHRVRGVLRFYEWAVQMCWLSDSKICGLGARFDVSPSSNGKIFQSNTENHSFFVLRQFEALPAPFSPQELREIFVCLAPPYHLIARWQLYTGLRIAEVLKLTRIQIEQFNMYSSGVISVVRKGRKQGEIIAPASLIDETRSYMKTYRSAWIQRARRAGRDVDDFALFINSRGAPVGRSAYQRAVCSAGKTIGRKATTHIFRATFACMMLARLERFASEGKEINPLMIVKILMGHENIETTDRYLRAIMVDKNSIKEALDSLARDSQ